MGRIIEVVKLKYDEETKLIHYSYRSIDDDDSVGELKIDKITGEIFIEKLAPNDKNGGKGQLAFSALRRCWRAGELPDITWSAS